MKFLPKDLCVKLVDMGCVSDSGYIFDPTALDKEARSPKHLWPKNDYLINCFSFEDFAGTTPQARENARKVWPEQYNMGVPCPDGLPGCGVFHCKTVFVANEKRHHMIEAEDWIEFIRPYIEKAYEKQKEK